MPRRGKGIWRHVVHQRSITVPVVPLSNLKTNTHHRRLKHSKLLSTLLIPSVILSFSAFVWAGPSIVARAADEPQCSTLTLVSDGGTQTAGWTETNPGSAPASLQASAYSAGSFSRATAAA